jgi:preprotein translocase subunit SecE
LVPPTGPTRGEKWTLVNAFLRELFHVGIYKRTQGRVARQVTFAAAAVTWALGLFGLWESLGSMLTHWPGNWLNDWKLGRNEAVEAVVRQSVHHGLPFLLLLLGLWAFYRLVNVPRFADFLIAVEAEMNKVSWPTRGELYRSSVVVLVTIFALAILLFGFDLFWQRVFTWLRIL